jgi:hypothetical protein
MDDFDRLAIQAALSILDDERQSPGSQEKTTLELAREILTGNNYPVPNEIPVPA